MPIRLSGSRLRKILPHVCYCLVILLVLIGLSYPESPAALGLEQSRRTKVPASGTPVAVAKPVAAHQEGGREETEGQGGDPLDGDPLDGEPASSDGAVDDLIQLDIVRSGRPVTTPDSVVAYDHDTKTRWAPTDEGESSWLWLDLGAGHELRQIRWLARGSGTIDLFISHDRQKWEAIEAGDRSQLWQETSLRDEGRYIRLELIPGDDGDLPEIAEVEVYGTDGNPDSSLAQKAKKDRKGKGKKDRNRKGSDDKSSNSKSDDTKSNKDDKPAKSRNKDKSSKDDQNVETRDGVSVQAGETHCSGDRERCRARAGKVSMEDECGAGGSCTIDIQADGGSATCDATGGNENRAGDGEGKRNGNGGRCEAVANGGAVSMGDINP